MIEFANDLVEIAVTNITENEDIMDTSQVEDLSRWKERWEKGLDDLAISDYWIYFERLDQTSETLEIQETDTPTVRLLKARTYLMASGELLKRVIFVVVGDISISVPN